MKVVRARIMGFCPGVRRAVAAAMAAADGADGRRVAVLGQIVHNPRVSAELAARGVSSLRDEALRDEALRDEALGDALGDATRSEASRGGLAGAIVVIRSHGAGPEVVERLRKAGADVVDATCPRVAANQKAAAEYARSGAAVLIAGDRGHGEVLGVAGYAPGSVVVSDAREAAAAAAALEPDRPVAIIPQTTLSREEYDAICAAVRELRPAAALAGGICPATAERRAAMAELCARVDAVVVVGGRNSANTRRLAELARSLGKPAWHVESADEIPAELGSYATVGLSAGASTPDADVDEAEARLLSL